MPTLNLIKAIAVTAELTGTQFSEIAAEVMATDLALYPENQVMKALTRCRRELKGRLTIADVVTRLDDGRPGAEEAWSMIPRDEAATVVWTDEMAVAFGVVTHMLAAGEEIPARMAFKEKYLALVAAARDNRTAPKWTPSLGSDPNGRMAALETAVMLGRMSDQHALSLVPSITVHPKVLEFIKPGVTALLNKAKEAANANA